MTRAKLGDPTEYGSGMVDPYGYVGFVDEAVHHATPFYGHRWVTGLHLKQYLQERYPAAYKEAATAFPKFMSSWDYYSGFQGWVDKSIISAADSKKWLAWMKIVTNQADDMRHLTRVDLKATMSEAEFDDVLEAVGAAEPAKRNYGRSGRLPRGVDPQSSPQQPITPKNKRPLKRRLSQPDFRQAAAARADRDGEAALLPDVDPRHLQDQGRRPAQAPGGEPGLAVEPAQRRR